MGIFKKILIPMSFYSSQTLYYMNPPNKRDNMQDKDIAKFYDGFFTNTTTPKRDNMTQISIADWLATTPKRDNMYSFQPLTPAHRTADYYLDTWIKTMQEIYRTHPIYARTNLLYGKIIRTSMNYIAIGYNQDGEWVEIPCANLNTARLYMMSYMNEDDFKFHSNGIHRHAIEVHKDWYGATTWATK